MSMKSDFESHKWKEVIRSKSPEKFSRNDLIYYVQAAIFLNNIDLAINALRKTKDHELLLYKALCEAHKGDTDTAMEIISSLEGTIKPEHEIRLLITRAYCHSIQLNQGSASKDLKKVEKLLKGSGNTPLKYWAYTIQAITLLRQSKHESAMEKCRDIINSQDAPIEYKGMAYRYLGIIYSYAYNYYDAISYYNLALNEFRKIRHNRGLMKTYTSLGFTYINMGELKLGEFFSKKALKIAQGSHCLLNQGKINNRLGNLYILRDEREKALKCFKMDYEISSKLQNKALIGFSTRNIGRLKKLNGEFDKAAEFLNKSLEAFGHCEDPINLSLTKMEILELNAEKAGYEKLLLEYEALLNSAGIKGSVELRANLQIKFAAICRNIGRNKEAGVFLGSAAQLLARKQNIFRYVEVLYLLGTVHHQMEECEKALGFLKDAYALVTEHSISYLNWEIVELIGEMEPEYMIERSRDIITERSELKNMIAIEEAKVIEKFNDYYIVGTSKMIKNVVARAGKLASTDTTVLLSGETGVGKEIFAAYIHHHSKRRNRIFVPVNCGVLHGSGVLAAELFGYKKGAFTGALNEHPGKVRAAAGGTLFLDEIDKMDLGSQGMLLRLLENHEIQPVGSMLPEKVDARIVLSTSKNLPQLTLEKQFLEYLFYRISGFIVDILEELFLKRKLLQVLIGEKYDPRINLLG